MVSHDELLRIARRHDTVMSLAMLRALGHEGEPRGHARGDGPRGGARGHAPRGGWLEHDRARYRGMLWCFSNPTSPMDRR